MSGNSLDVGLILTEKECEHAEKESIIIVGFYSSMLSCSVLAYVGLDVGSDIGE